jgi:hypothetical protein
MNDLVKCPICETIHFDEYSYYYCQAKQSKTPIRNKKKQIQNPEKKHMTKSNKHTTHCCAFHGCKYGDADCPVIKGIQIQERLCEECFCEEEYEPIESQIARLQKFKTFKDKLTEQLRVAKLLQEFKKPEIVYGVCSSIFI